MGKSFYVKGDESSEKVSNLIYVSAMLFIAVLFAGWLTQKVEPVVAQSSDPTPAPALSVALDPTMPVSNSVMPGSTNVEVLRLQLTANAGGDVTVDSMAVLKTGLSTCPFQNYRLRDVATGTQINASWQLVTSCSIIFTNMGGASLGNVVPRASTKSVAVYVDVTADAQAGQTFAFQLSKATASAPVSGLPVNGPVMTIGGATPQPFITVFSPNGGEKLVEGQNFTIRWSGGPSNDTAIIRILAPNFQPGWDQKIAEVPNTGSYNWTVSYPLSASGVDYHGSPIFIIGVTLKTAWQYSDSSDAPFSIVSGSSGTSVSAVPILELKYFPTVGGSVDTTQTGDWQNPDLTALRQHVKNLSDFTITALERGSTYRGYKDTTAVPALDYTILDSLEYLTPVPVSARFPQTADHLKILGDLNICDYIENKGVKEVWVWMYHTSTLAPIESNMAGPYGDISNSARVADLPVCKKTYTVYDYNYGRGVGEAVEDHGHQLEAIFSYVDGLLWNKFVFPYGKTDGTVNRCGNTHNPPNSRHEYDWANKEFVASDCEDWRPDSIGTVKQLNCNSWTPDSPTCSHGTDYFKDANTTWKIYWMQNMPGAGNTLTYNGLKMRNWWEFIGDFDSALARGKSLTEPTQSSITVLYPNGGETLMRGTNTQIKWSAPNVITGSQSLVDIYLALYYPPCTGDMCPKYPYQAPYTIAKNIPSGGWKNAYGWTVGKVTDADMAKDGVYYIQICQSGAKEVCDQSDSYFKIASQTSTNTPPQITGITAPTSLHVGETSQFGFAAVDPDRDDLSWAVSWGEAGISTAVACPVSPQIGEGKGRGYTAQHAWSAPGTYRVNVYVSDCHGGEDRDAFSVVVGGSGRRTVIWQGLAWTPIDVGATAPDDGTWYTFGDELRQDGVTDRHYKVVATSMAPQTDYEVKAVVRLQSGSEVGLCGRLDDMGNGYCYAIGGSRQDTIIAVFQNNDQNPEVAAISRDFTFDQSAEYVLKLRLNGQHVQGKVYRLGQTEPAEWAIDFEDSRFKSGKVGLYTYGSRPIFTYLALGEQSVPPRTEPVPPMPTPRDESIERMERRASLLYDDRLSAILAELKLLRDLVKEQQTEIKYLRSLTSDLSERSSQAEAAIRSFIAYGVDENTKKLGEGERAAVMHSYKSAFDKLPETEEELADAIKIANGRWPGEESAKAENRAETEFKKIYLRDSNLKNPNDDAAVTIMAYGLRQRAENRNLRSEARGILTFRQLYHRTPQSTEDWNIVQAITYSGAKR